MSTDGDIDPKDLERGDWFFVETDYPNGSVESRRSVVKNNWVSQGYISADNGKRNFLIEYGVKYGIRSWKKIDL